MPTDDFSGYSESHFSGVRFAACADLVALLRDLRDGDEAFVRARYENAWQHYEQAASLLMAAGLIERKGGRIRAIDGDEAQGLAEKVITGLASRGSAVAEELQEFVRNFQRTENGLTYFPHELQRSGHSAVRNFLLEAGLLESMSTGGPYRLVPKYHETIYRLMRLRASTTAERLQEFSEKRSAIGRSAELVVLENERTRLGATHQDHVVHISLNDSEAGYDIRSLRSKTEPSPIFLEVKAVSEVDWCFYWTRNEMAAAQWLGESYCLILVPVAAGGECAIEKAYRLWNPAASGPDVIMTPAVWHCKLAQANGSRGE